MSASLVRYDGVGVKTDGWYCVYSVDYNYCTTNTLAYDGVGVKPFSDTASTNQYCTGGTFLVYDGTGLKPTSYGNVKCIPTV